MASAEDIAALRLLIDEPDTTTYSDQDLSSLIDQKGSDKAASEIWLRKAASFATAVDMSEGGSSRSNSKLQQQALTMAELFAGRAEEASSSAGRVGTQVSRIRRK